MTEQSFVHEFTQHYSIIIKIRIKISKFRVPRNINFTGSLRLTMSFTPYTSQSLNILEHDLYIASQISPSIDQLIDRSS